MGAGAGFCPTDPDSELQRRVCARGSGSSHTRGCMQGCRPASTDVELKGATSATGHTETTRSPFVLSERHTASFYFIRQQFD